MAYIKKNTISFLKYLFIFQLQLLFNIILYWFQVHAIGDSLGILLVFALINNLNKVFNSCLFYIY